MRASTELLEQAALGPPGKQLVLIGGRVVGETRTASGFKAEAGMRLPG